MKSLYARYSKFHHLRRFTLNLNIIMWKYEYKKQKQKFKILHSLIRILGPEEFHSSNSYIKLVINLWFAFD